MKARTMYLESIAILNPDHLEAYTYRRDGENLGSLILKMEEGREVWRVLDFMNNVGVDFNSKNKAREFIKNHTPIFVDED